MNSIQADIATRNLSLLEEKLESLAVIRERYNSAFDYSNDSDHLYRIRVKNRDNFIDAMTNSDIQCGIHYKSVHEIECYKPLKITNLEKTKIESKQTVSIPYHEKLTSEQISHIISEVRKHADFA